MYKAVNSARYLLKSDRGSKIQEELHRVNPNEQVVWIGKSSHVYYFWFYLLFFCTSFLIFPMFFAVMLYLYIEAQLFVVTTERIRIYKGVLVRRISDINLFRLIDTTFEQNLWCQIVNVATITIYTSDEVNPVIKFRGICDPGQVREMMRKYALLDRTRHGVQSIDYFPILPFKTSSV